MRIAVLGDGGWGTALALVLIHNGHEVTLWGPFADYCEATLAAGENTKFLPGVPLPANLAITADREAAVAGADGAVLASPTTFYRDVVTSFRGHLPASLPLVSVSKGFDKETRALMTELASSLLDGNPVAALSGPSHAEEVAKGVPSAVAVACEDHDRAVLWQGWFNCETFRIYTTDDVVGVQLGGALKNVIALAAGICDGIGFGDNTKAALITRGLAEMTRLGAALGAHRSTFAGLSGLGDLIVTCASRHSRNRGVGERLGKGESIDEILGSMEQVAEGVYACEGAHEIGRDRGIELPIADEVYAVVHDGKNPGQAVRDLLARDPKPERD